VVPPGGDFGVEVEGHGQGQQKGRSGVSPKEIRFDGEGEQKKGGKKTAEGNEFQGFIALAGEFDGLGPGSRPAAVGAAPGGIGDLPAALLTFYEHGLSLFGPFSFFYGETINLEVHYPARTTRRVSLNKPHVLTAKGFGALGGNNIIDGFGRRINGGAAFPGQATENGDVFHPIIALIFNGKIGQHDIPKAPPYSSSIS
jgi:hypothetical protein